ncbi:cyclic pyranopterin monophosphate synthase MoaC [Miniphocaeibacter massiliensis]|uniref:cyclic pyranopterin monophosphate synthase MoaC n=1 Tax=Miniphocaeibacter massiliensis TaxID=2041841 RepID=UPI000C1BA9F3
MDLTHFNESGRAKMVNVGEKEDTKRVATATCTVIMKKETLDRIKIGQIKKGDVLAVAQVAGIMGAKNTSQTIPMCHNIFITGVDIEFELGENTVDIFATVKTTGKTGVEMEALNACSTTALTIYDMCKAIDRGMEVSNLRLLEKEGGKSGRFVAENKQGTVIDVNISETKGVIKTPIGIGTLKVDHGLVGDAHAGDWHRQISLLAEESIEKMKAMGLPDLKDGDFAENITTRGLVLHEIPVGTVFTMGTAVLEVTQIGKKCHKGCAIKQQVGNCIMPTEGIFAKVLKDGEVKKGDKIRLIEI